MPQIFKTVGFVCLLVVVAVIYSSVTLSEARHVDTSEEDKMPKIVQCWDLDPMIGDVPHPRNCYKFFSCVPAPPNSPVMTTPVERDCPMGENGPLYYDFRNCSCQYNNSVCFDGARDGAEFFTCAKVYDAAADGVTLEPVPT